jgi:hypothetical protein
MVIPPPRAKDLLPTRKTPAPASHAVPAVANARLVRRPVVPRR